MKIKIDKDRNWKDQFPKENRYFETESGILYYNDCLKIMKRLNKRLIDWIITDPPYGISINKMGFTTNLKGGIAKRNDYRGKAEWDKKIDKVYFDLMFKVSKNQIIFGGNYYTNILPPTKSWIIWDKKTNDKYRNDFADCELAWASKGVARVFRWLWHGFLQQNMKDKEKRYHPTQKPINLLIQIISFYTQKSDLILDPFLGSGTTAIACEKLNRKWIGIEISKEYCEITKERILNLRPNINSKSLFWLERETKNE